MTLLRARRQFALALAAGWLACAACAVHAQAQGLGLVRASAVKAAFLYKFGSFVEYPAGAFKSGNAPFVIGVFGDGDALPAVHILYAGGPRESRVRDMLDAVHGPVLTVADGPVPGKSAPVLYFTEEQGRLRFAASLTAAAARGLKLSSKLLAVAQSVEGR